MKSAGKPEGIGGVLQTEQSSLQRLYSALERAKLAFDALGRRYIDPERFVRIIMAAARRPPKKEGQKTILDCTTQSVILACMEASAMGLEPETPQNHCYLIPYGSVCTLQMGYPGLVTLALRDPSIKRIEARLRYARDVFKPQYAPQVTLEHLPCLDDDRGEAVGVYALAHFADGEMDFEYMSLTEVNVIRDRRAKGLGSDSSPWRTDEGEMQRKTVLKRACKRWGKGKEISIALAIDNDEGKLLRAPSPEVADMFADLTPSSRVITLPPVPVPPPLIQASAPPLEDEQARWDREGDGEPTTLAVMGDLSPPPAPPVKP